MTLKIEGARENNLRNLSLAIGDGLTVVTGVSGSGKSSLVYNTIYHEARRRYFDIFTPRSSRHRIQPAQVDSIEGLYPAISIDQNSVNRNPNSTLATITGLHPFLRILYTNFGTRYCPQCRTKVTINTHDELTDLIFNLSQSTNIHIYCILAFKSLGSHKLLLSKLSEITSISIFINGKKWENSSLDPLLPHTIELLLGTVEQNSSPDKNGLKQFITEILHKSEEYGSYSIIIRYSDTSEIYALADLCPTCDYWFEDVEPKHFNAKCPDCSGKGCTHCYNTGLFPSAAVIRWQGYTITELLGLTVMQLQSLLKGKILPNIADRLLYEISRRIDSLVEVGLEYLTLNRSSPTLSRGESQRVRLSIVLASRIENMLHILDEPTIGLSVSDVKRFLPSLQKLNGPVIYVEHDRVAASIADEVIDIGPSAGINGGSITFQGSTPELWTSNTISGKYFSYRESVQIPAIKVISKNANFMTFKSANFRYLKDITIQIPLKYITVITGVSGSGKSTLVEEVIEPTLNNKKPIGCVDYTGPKIKAIVIDQNPIGRNPRSNPATYTKLADIIRDLFATATGMNKSHFSFNRKEGQCEQCKGIGAEEYKLPFIAPMWITCEACDGQRFNPAVLNATIPTKNGKEISIHQLYSMSIQEAMNIVLTSKFLSESKQQQAEALFTALLDIGLGYLSLGQTSPTLSGGEAQRIKLTKYLGKSSNTNTALILDEPTTGLHPADIAGLLHILRRLVENGATIIIIEHNTDIVEATDWLIELGPKSGVYGGYLQYQGPLKDAPESSSTMQAMKQEKSLIPQERKMMSRFSDHITIKNAHANNLKNINIQIPKNAITVVTGKSGSGKSSLVRDVLEVEARRRFLESLSVYERQSTLEGAQAQVDTVSGLGVTASLKSSRIQYTWRIDPRYTVGKASELSVDIHNLLLNLGTMECPLCNNVMNFQNKWICSNCKHSIEPFDVGYLSFSNTSFGYTTSACPECKGLGTIQIPNIDKLIIDPTKPICGGAMYSPGFWPYGYYCKKYNGAYMILQGLAKELNFDPTTTPWNELPEDTQQAFLFGYDKQLDYIYESRNQGPYPAKGYWRGPFQEWGGMYADLFETYSDTVTCKKCHGKKLKPDYLALKLDGLSVYNLEELPLLQLQVVLSKYEKIVDQKDKLIKKIYSRVVTRLQYINLVGLGYMNLNRMTYTLSAGEYERLQLVSILGSGLSNLTILLDEPSRGLHPSEISNLITILRQLQMEGNQIIIVEHDLDIIRSSDYIVDLGPEGGKQGGNIVMNTSISKVRAKKYPKSYTARWLEGLRKTNHYGRLVLRKDQIISSRREAQSFMQIQGAKANNLKNLTISIPLGILTGICGVSGSGKSSLIIDTLVRVLAPKKHTTSLANEEITPGKHNAIINAPKNVFYVDQSRYKITSPWNYLGLKDPLIKIFLESEDGELLGVTEKQLKAPCGACNGKGYAAMDMGFLPTIYSPCDTCHMTGMSQIAFEIAINGYTLPDIVQMTFDEVYNLIEFPESIASKLKMAITFGLGYLVLKQPIRTLSAGEIQRLRLVKQLARKQKPGSLFVFDEPSIGMSTEDVELLIKVLHFLVDNGHSVLVIEHHLHLLAACDWLIELGPVGGPDGGYLVAEGTPETVAKSNTPTSSYLAKILEVNS